MQVSRIGKVRSLSGPLKPMNGVHEAYQLIALSITAPASIMDKQQVPVNVLDLARSFLRQSAHVLSFQENKKHSV